MDNLLKLTQEQKYEIWKQYSLQNHPLLQQREHGEIYYSQRNSYQRDYARILCSPSFRRLQGKMQIVGIKASAFYRNRLTHSLEVAQIATSIARLLAHSVDKTYEMYTIDDIHVIEAAALAHDIGHPAFGHKGERVLNELAQRYDLHFEGNAQNYRVLRTLEKKEREFRGLNLTNRTLLAINKYIVKESDDKEKFMYTPDYDYLMSIRKKIEGLSNVRTLDVQIIELADDIAYAVHDLEDGLALRNFTINEVLFMLKKEANELYNLFNGIVTTCMDYANSSIIDNVQDHSKLFRMRLTSRLTDLFVRDVTISKISDKKAAKCGTKVYQELTLNEYSTLLKKLKNVIFACTIRDNDIHIYEMRGEIVLKSLFKLYSDVKANIDGKLMPPDYRPSLHYEDCKDIKEMMDAYQKELAQKSIDYLAGMMDTYAIEEYERLFNNKFNEISLDSSEK